MTEFALTAFEAVVFLASAAALLSVSIWAF